MVLAGRGDQQRFSGERRAQPRQVSFRRDFMRELRRRARRLAVVRPLAHAFAAQVRFHTSWSPQHDHHAHRPPVELTATTRGLRRRSPIRLELVRVDIVLQVTGTDGQFACAGALISSITINIIIITSIAYPFLQVLCSCAIGTQMIPAPAADFQVSSIASSRPADMSAGTDIIAALHNPCPTHRTRMGPGKPLPLTYLQPKSPAPRNGYPERCLVG
jgi:hypothetical protein